MHRILSCCIALSLVLCVSPVSAVVPLTTGPDYPPFTDQDAPQGGIAVQVVRAVFARISEPISLEWLPWKRGYLLTLSGSFRATFPYVRSPERERDFIFSEPIATVRSFLYTRPGDNLDFEAPASFSGRVLCVPQGYYSPLETSLHTLIENGALRLERAPDMRSCMRMLAAGRVDAFTALDLQVQQVLRQSGGVGQIQQSLKPIGSVDLMLIAPRHDPQAMDLIQRFNTGLLQLKADGSYKKLVPD